ncbi:hypothetical protein CSOJ01_12971 [Colletotrichum sojae]|uniref:Uncharacterized protein n=1 Tax=Colletotrichum sojae TaxID=2175907 RepID=A0A8H6IU98_9PEZI|nr:hypothetical protein CSOJ01_12971 [Colletotrichum sojae]
MRAAEIAEDVLCFYSKKQHKARMFPSMKVELAPKLGGCQIRLERPHATFRRPPQGLKGSRDGETCGDGQQQQQQHPDTAGQMRPSRVDTLVNLAKMHLLPTKVSSQPPGFGTF